MSANLENDDIVVNTKMLFNDGKPHTIKANKITFDGGAIIARGTPLTIEANELMVTGKPPLGGNYIQILGVDGKDGAAGTPGKTQGPGADGKDAHGGIFCTSATAGSNGLNGTNGGNGENGGDGIPSEVFTLSILSVDSGSSALTFINISGRGGNGGNGGNGGTGGHGGKGGNGETGDCCSGAHGGRGGSAGNGGNGGDGGKAVHGLPITITFPDKAKKLLVVKQVDAAYGKPGVGAAPGSFASGGKGGWGSGLCPAGNPGPNGVAGKHGKDGTTLKVVGLPGEITYHWIDNKPVDDN